MMEEGPSGSATALGGQGRGTKRKLSEDEEEEEDKLDSTFRRRKKKRLLRQQHCFFSEERHGANAMQALWMMTSTGDLCDAKIEVGVKREIVFCHKNVLVVSSDYFKKMFSDKYQENVDQMGIISLDKEGKDGFSKDAVESVVRFIYLGNLSKQSSVTVLIPDIYMLAHIWLLHDLEDLCVNRMMKDVGIKNFNQLLRFADQFSLSDLKDVVNGFIARSLPDILNESEFASLQETDIEQMLKNSFTYCHQNQIWLEAVKRWCKGSDEKFVVMVKKAKPGLMSKLQIEELVKHEDLQNNSELKTFFENKFLTKEHSTYTCYFPYIKSHSSIRKSLTFGMFISFRKNDIIVKKKSVDQNNITAKLMFLPEVKDFEDFKESAAAKTKQIVRSDLVLESQVCYKNTIIALAKSDLCGTNPIDGNSIDQTLDGDSIDQTLPLIIFSLVEGTFNLIPFDIRKLLQTWRELYRNEENIAKLSVISSIYVDGDFLYYLTSNDVRIALFKLNLEHLFGKIKAEWTIVFDLELGDDYFRFASTVKIGIILIKPFEIFLNISKSSMYGEDAYAIERIKLPDTAIQDHDNPIGMETVTEIPVKEFWGIDPSTDFDSIQEFLVDEKKETIFVTFNTSNPMGRLLRYSNRIIKFDLTTEEWSPLPNMKIGKSFCSLSLHGNRLFAVGIDESSYLTCEALNLNTGNWESLAILDNKMRRRDDWELQYMELKSTGFPVNHMFLGGSDDGDSDEDSDSDSSDALDSLELSFRTSQYEEELELNRSGIEDSLKGTEKLLDSTFDKYLQKKDKFLQKKK